VPSEPATPIPLRSERSSATTGDLSVAAIRARQSSEEAERRAEIDAILAKARAARGEGKPSVARIYYQQALRRTTGEEAQIVRKELAALTEP